jgi:hypothetical protein
MSARAGAMHSARTRREGVSCVSLKTHISDGMRSCAGISMSACAGAMSCTMTGREVVTCFSDSGHTMDGTTTIARSRKGISVNAHVGAMSFSSTGFSLCKSLSDDGTRCVSGIGLGKDLGTKDVISEQDLDDVNTNFFPLDKCTLGFSPGCLSPQSWHVKMPMNPNQGPTPTSFTPVAPQRLLPHMNLVATSHVPMSDSSTIIHLLKKLHSRKDLIMELLAYSNCHCDIVDCLTIMKPPIIAQASDRNRLINCIDSTNHYPMDENAFSVYGRGTRVGQPQPNRQSEAKAKHYAMCNVIKSLLNVGTLEQHRLVLFHVLSHHKVRNIALSIGVNRSVLDAVEEKVLKGTSFLPWYR